jgi:cytosine/adenosine deaminase-related metal-dependent hydrolase
MAELVVRGGLVVPGDGIEPFVGDVVVEGGRIAAAGPARRPATATEEVDASGCLVIPGLVQAHVHLCQTLLRGLADDMEVIEWLRRRVWPLEQAHDHRSLRASAMLAVAELLTGGTTAALTIESDRHTGAAFEAAEELGIRATIGKALMDRYEPGTEMEVPDSDAAWADQMDLFETWHGRDGGRLRVALSPRGPRNATPETWRRCVALAEEANLRLHTHVNENRAQADLLGASPEGRDLEALESWGALSPRMVMAHAVWLSDHERDLARRHRPHVCHCPSANLKLASGFAPVPGYLADGLNVALGADGAPCNNRLDGFEEMRLAALLHKPVAGPRAVPARTAFDMATMGGARALALEREIGSIEPGKRADLAVVRRDRLHTTPTGGADAYSELVYAHTASDVDTVVVDGRVVVADGRLLTGDEADIRAEANAQQSALITRANITN